MSKYTVKHRYYQFVQSEKRIFHKYYNFLVDLCKKENIKLVFCKNPQEINSILGRDGDELCAGKYVYYVKNGKLIENSSTIYIAINSSFETVYDENRKYQFSCVTTLAHELGHHFAIKLKNNDTEEAADRYIVKFAHTALHPIEFESIKFLLYIAAVHKGITFNKQDRDGKLYINYREFDDNLRGKIDNMYNELTNKKGRNDSTITNNRFGIFNWFVNNFTKKEAKG